VCCDNEELNNKRRGTVFCQVLAEEKTTKKINKKKQKKRVLERIPTLIFRGKG